MSITRRLLPGLLAVAAGLTLAPGASAASDLYVAEADGGRLERDGDGWTLLLQNPDPTITTFSDRPERTGGRERLTTFVSAWKRTFGDDPPNAALQIRAAPHARDVVLLELGEPKYRPARDVISFPVTPITRTSARQLKQLAARADAPRARGFGRATLFIDDGDSGTPTQTSIVLAGTDSASATITFNNATFVAGPNATNQTGANNPLTATTTVGTNTLSFSTVSFSDSPQPYLITSGQMLSIDGPNLTGTATITGNATVTITAGNAPDYVIGASGTFNIPVS